MKDAMDIENEEGAMDLKNEDITPTRTDILEAARYAITVRGDRDHGSARRCFDMVAAFWSADLGTPIEAHDVARLMALFKLARARCNPKLANNPIDAAGYAAIMGEFAEALD